jgi:phage terminase large subunit
LTLSATTLDPWQQAWLNSRNNPLLFVTDVLNAKPYPWQVDALNAAATRQRLSIRAGHGVGKTRLLAWLALWWMYTRKPNKILVTANSQDQLRDVTWPEIKLAAADLPKALYEQYEWGMERIALKAAPEQCFASARTATKDRPENLQGFHSKHTLILVEEASGIPDELFPVMLGALSTDDARLVMAANPTRLSGYFYDSHHVLRERFATFRVNSEDVPHARGHIEDIVLRFGKDSNAYRVRVQGEFPTQEDETVIPLILCEAAKARKVEPKADYRVVWGVDVARFGNDRSALAKRRGNVQTEPVKFYRGMDTMQLAGRIMDEYNKCWPLEDRPSEILVDVIGIGAGVVDRCAELGLPVRGINVGEAAAISDRYMRLRDELWFRARQWLEEKDCKLADDDALIGELVQPLYTFSSSGKIVVESKDDMKKRAIHSPDLADAWCLTFAGGLDKIEEDPSSKRYRKKAPGRSWMSA